jgi:hypothetical protein
MIKYTKEELLVMTVKTYEDAADLVRKERPLTDVENQLFRWNHRSICNRISAKASRVRRRKELETLQRENKRLALENQVLRSSSSTLAPSGALLDTIADLQESFDTLNRAREQTNVLLSESARREDLLASRVRHADTAAKQCAERLDRLISGLHSYEFDLSKHLATHDLEPLFDGIVV